MKENCFSLAVQTVLGHHRINFVLVLI